MTRLEAIAILDGFKYNPLLNNQHYEALDMAISALSENRGEPTYYPPCIDCNKKMDEIRRTYDKLKELPSVENKGEWIPVTERLPKIADVYRVTRYYPNNVMNPNYLVDACCFDGSNTWYDDNRINHERAYVDNVIAWQENPEPYKGESEEYE